MSLVDRTAIVTMIRAEVLCPGSVMPVAASIVRQGGGPYGLDTVVGRIEGVTPQIARIFLEDMDNAG